MTFKVRSTGLNLLERSEVKSDLICDHVLMLRIHSSRVRTTVSKLEGFLSIFQ